MIISPEKCLLWHLECQEQQLPDLVRRDKFPSFHRQRLKPSERWASGGDCLDQIHRQTPPHFHEEEISATNLQKNMHETNCTIKNHILHIFKLFIK